ncbi:hypothetical protein [Microcoleus phage My-WqHQDG]|nr:hypothetical protein [Microcoleus phage My-WqHQDG]
MTTSTDKLFEQATRNKYRYLTQVGELTTEQLWDLPMTTVEPRFPNGKDKPDLDKVAKAIAAELRSITEESFVKTSTNPREAVLTSMLEVVKHIISVKQEEVRAREEKAVRATKRAQYLEAYEAKQKAEISAEVSAKSSKELLELINGLED